MLCGVIVLFLLQKIEELMMNHHDARYAVGEFVLHEQTNLHHYTISQIAEYTYTSKATVVRFAKTVWAQKILYPMTAAYMILIVSIT